MLSDEAIEKLIQPILQRQQNISLYVIKIIAQRIKQIGTLLPSDIKKLEQLLKYGGDVKKINAEISLQTGLQIRDIKAIIKGVAKDAYEYAKPFYDYRHKSYIPFNENTRLQRMIKAVGKITADSYVNLSNSKATGFLIRDMKNPDILKFQSIKDTYKSVVDEAIQASQQGVVDYNTAIRKTLKQLTNSGIRRVAWESGYTQRLDVALKRNIIEGIRNINREVQIITGEEFGADGIEIDAYCS